jgi:hypothetical protein
MSLRATLGLALAIAACSSTEPDRSTAWGSDQASLTIAAGSATLQVVASGGCYGSYGEITQPVLSSSFTLSGTYTQLMGVFPGFVQYPAEFSGTILRGRMTLSLTIPALQQTLGPFQLTQGVVKSWPACLYP